jgi:hypothetical protein
VLPVVCNAVERCGVFVVVFKNNNNNKRIEVFVNMFLLVAN